jgi:integrase/recombinase XerC/integrase/recombinase XerD
MSKKQTNQEKVHKLSELITYYEVCNKAEGKTQRTINWYSDNLHQFRAYVLNKHHSENINSIDTKLIREYILYLMAKHRFETHPYNSPTNELLSSSTVHGHVRTLRAFSNWLLKEKLTNINFTAGIKPPKIVKKVISTLSEEEIAQVLSTFNPSSVSDMRNKVMFMLLLDTGLRIGELINLKLDDVNIEEGLMKVMGKGKKERMVPIGNKAQKVLHSYLFRFRPKPAHSGINNAFLSVFGTPITENSVELVFARLARRSGVKRLHAHLCRHTFATMFLLNGGDIFTLQQILGHSTLEMVRNYVTLASNQVAMRHHKYSPLDRLNSHKE